MNWFNFDLRKAILVAAILLVPLISVNTQKRPTETGWYNRPFSFVAGLLQQGLFSFSDGVKSTTRLYLDLVNIKKENAELKHQNQTVLAQLAGLEELKTENNRLNALLEFKHKNKMELVAARVMSRDLVSDHSTIQLNKGTRHGIKAGQAVITIGGVVGYIFRPEAFTSHVLLLTDRYSVVDGIVSRSRARGLVEGKNQVGCVLRHVEKSEDVQKGDLIVTSGLDNIFPKGFPVATVDSVENKPYAVSLKIDLRPVVDPNKLEEVFVIINANNEDMSDRITMRN